LNSAAIQTLDQAQSGRSSVAGYYDARRWISEFAYALWLAEGQPEGQDKRHWYQAEVAYRKRMAQQLSESERAREAARLKSLIARNRPYETPRAEDVALAALAMLPDVEKALETVSQLRGLLECLISEDVVDDGFQILKIWNYELDGKQKAEKIAEAIRLFGNPSTLTDDPDQDDPGVRIMDKEVLQQAVRTFEAELPEMLKTHPREWVAYHGARRVGFGRSKTEVLKECMEQGIRYEQLLVRMVQPNIPATPVTW